MDERQFELASRMEQTHRDSAIEKAGKQEVETDPTFDGVNCVQCDNEIPEGRLALGKIRCTFCQTKLERRNGTR